CLLNAYTSIQGASPDSIIAIAKEVIATDSTSLTAIANIAEAYRLKADTANMVDAMLRLYRADKTNRKIVDNLLPIFAVAAPEKGIQVIDDLLKDNPGDLELLDSKWKLQYRAKLNKEGMATGEEIVKIDPARATLDWFNRQLAFAQTDSNAAKVI